MRSRRSTRARHPAAPARRSGAASRPARRAVPARMRPRHRTRGAAARAALSSAVGGASTARGQHAEEHRQVGFDLLQQLEQLAHQLVVARPVERDEPELAAPARAARRARRFRHRPRAPAPAAPCRSISGQQRIGELHEVPLRDLRLVAVAVAPPLRVGGVRRPVRIVALEPAVRAVVDGQPEDRHVVGVHHAVHEADAHPVGDQRGGAAADLFEPARISRGRRRAQLRENALRSRSRPGA